jgi:hypothetical protein
MWPALFITDITDHANDVWGDWQWGGAAVNPTYVAGTWKGAVRTVDAMGASITPDADPVANHQNYGNGDMAPAGSIAKLENYGTEVRWDIRLEAGHNYRFQVMVHDGDQNKIGGDAGEACVTFCADQSCPIGHSSCTTSANCTGGDVCSDGCCISPPSAADGGGGGGGNPPPMNGQCPSGYVLTIRNNEQVCTPLQIR